MLDFFIARRVVGFLAALFLLCFPVVGFSQQINLENIPDAETLNQMMKDAGIDPNHIEQFLRENGIDPNAAAGSAGEVDIETINQTLKDNGIDTGNLQIDPKVVDNILTSLGVNKLSSNDEWVCTCILCLANPKGPTAEPKCREPIKKLWRWLADPRNHGFPKACPDSDVTLSQPAFNPCPEGTRELKESEWLLTGGNCKYSKNNRLTSCSGGSYSRGRDWEDRSFGKWDNNATKYDPAEKACIPSNTSFSWLPDPITTDNNVKTAILDSSQVVWIKANPPGAYYVNVNFSNGFRFNNTLSNPE